MKALELKRHLLDLGFKHNSNYMIEGRFEVPTNWSIWCGIKFDIQITTHPFGEREICVDFILANTNLFASHKLEDLDFKTLHLELSKIITNSSKFDQWSKIELRNDKLNKIL